MIRSSRTGLDDRWQWADQAACRGEDLALFFGTEGERQAEKEEREAMARQICAGCPVRTDCLEYSISRPERYGIWGGLNEDQRGRGRRARMRSGAVASTTPNRPRKPKQERPTDGVPAVGSIRRVRALSHLGHGSQTIAARAQVSVSVVQRLRRREDPTVITRRAAARIASAYLLMLEEKPSSADGRPRRIALQYGWLPPAAWDGLDMDDPDAVPHELEEVA